MKTLAGIAIIAGLISSAALLRSAPRVAAAQPEQREGRREEKTIEKSFPVQGVHRVNAGVVIGKIHITTASVDTVQVKAVRYAEGGTENLRRRWLEGTRLDFKTQDGVLVIKDVIPKELQENSGKNNHFKAGLNLDVRVPVRMGLQLANVVGDVIVEGRTGDIDAESTAGSVRLRRLDSSGKSVNARSVAGNVEIDGQVGDLKVEDTAGNIWLKQLNISGRTAKIHNVAGSVEAAFLSLPTETLNVEVQTGKAWLSVPAQVRARVNMSSAMGKVSSSFPLHSTQREEGDFGGKLSGDLNGGGPTIRVEVAVGEAQLKRDGELKFSHSDKESDAQDAE